LNSHDFTGLLKWHLAVDRIELLSSLRFQSHLEFGWLVC
jgi:hypothetical protein